MQEHFIIGHEFQASNKNMLEESPKSKIVAIATKTQRVFEKPSKGKPIRRNYIPNEVLSIF